MPEPQVRKHRLSNMKYDEVSFVDVGANQEANVVLCKRTAADGSGGSSSDGGGRKANWYAADRNPGNADGSKREGKTLRAENWREDKHPRKPKGTGGGQFDKTSAQSKVENGRGGTTGGEKGGGTYTFKKGDSLQDIADAVYGDPNKWKLIADANGIKDPNKIPPGTVLKLPVENAEPEPPTPPKRPEKNTGGGSSSAGGGIVVSPGGKISRTQATSTSQADSDYQRAMEKYKADMEKYRAEKKKLADEKRERNRTNRNENAVSSYRRKKQRAASSAAKKKKKAESASSGESKYFDF